MLGKIDDNILSLANDPSFFKRVVASRVAGVASTALVAVALAIEMLVFPIIIALGALFLILSLLTCNVKSTIEALALMGSFTKQTALTAGCLCLNIFVAIISPKRLVAMHHWVEKNSKALKLKTNKPTKFPIEKTPRTEKLEFKTAPSIILPEEMIERGSRLINDETLKECDSASSTKDPIVLYGPKKNGKKAYAKQLGEKLGYSPATLTVDMKDNESIIKITKYALKYADKTEEVAMKAEEIKNKLKKLNLKSDFKMEEKKLKALEDAVATLLKEAPKLPILYVKNFTSSDRDRKILTRFSKIGFLPVCDAEKELDDLYFKTQIQVPLPPPEERKKIIEERLAKCPQTTDNIDIQKLVDNTADMPRKLILEHLEKGIRQARKEDAKVSDTHFKVQKKSSSTFAYVENKEVTEIFDKHLAVIQHWEKAQTQGIEMPAGILLHGAPGCGKTYAARSLQAYAEKKGIKMHFEVLNASDASGRYVGDGTKNIKQIFQNAEQNAPAIIFIDECDAVLHKRVFQEGHNAIEQNRTIAELLVQIENAKNKKIIVIGATNHLEEIDEAMARDGRFDYKLEIKMPDASMKRKIFELNLENKNCEENLNIEALVSETKDLSPSSIHTIINNASIEGLIQDKPLSTAMIRKEIARLKSSSKTEDTPSHMYT